MKRPQIINFFKKGTTLSYVHEVYKMNPELWAYIQALDAAYDDIESQLKEREKDHTKDKARLLVEKAKVENCRKQRDELQSKLKERDQICEKIISTMDHKDFWDNIQKLEDLMEQYEKTN